MIFKKVANNYIVVLKRGESIISSLREFCLKTEIKNGFFNGIGAIDEAELAHYDVSVKKYSSFKMNEPLEIISLIGNVFLGPENELIVHAHASFSRQNGETFGGHLVEARISGVCEIIFTPFKTVFQKTFDEETGLKILKEFSGD